MQIKLRVDVAIESELIEYLDSLGARSGEPKRILLEGFRSIRKKNSESEINNSDKEILDSKKSPFFNLASKG